MYVNVMNKCNLSDYEFILLAKGGGATNAASGWLTVYNRGRQPTCDNSVTQRDTRWHMSNRENCILTYILM